MDHTFKCGKNKFEYNLPKKSHFYKPIEPKFIVEESDFKNAISEYLHKTQLVKKNRIVSIAIVVADKTRLSEFNTYFPWIETTIKDFYNNLFRLKFFIAYGTHQHQTKEESIHCYGAAYKNYPFVHHDSDSTSFKSFGKTRRGTEIQINSELFESDLILTYGAISQHYFAGFGGGRKLIFPGLASKKSILQNHSLFLDFKNYQLNKFCKSGVLKNNPVAEDLKEIYFKLPKIIGIHTILNSRGEVCEVYIGDDYQAFENACMQYSNYYKLHVEKKYDLVIASSGGYPKDINFIQSHKSLHNASSFVKDGGKLILFSECSDGIGNSEFMNLIKMGNTNELFRNAKRSYQNNTGTALSFLNKTKRINICMVTSLSDDQCRSMHIVKISHKEVQSIVDNFDGTIAILGNASLIYI